MSRIAIGWSLTKASWAVLRADRSLAVFPLLSLVCATVAFWLVAGVGVAVSKAIQPWVVVPFLVVGLYVAIFCIVYFNVALAGAARRSIEGHDTTLRDGLAVARERRGVIAAWALLQLGFGLLVSALGSLLGGGGRGANNVIGAIAGAAWSVASFFVIPVLALVRERWGESLAGSVGVGSIVFLFAVVPVLGIAVGADALSRVNAPLAAVAYVLFVVALLAAFVLSSSLGVILRIELYRYATAGDLTGSFAKRDIDAAFRRK
jgi:hypothetical protein